MNYTLKRSGAKVLKWINLSKSLFRAGNTTVTTNYNPLSDAVIKAFNRSRPLGPQPLLCYAPYKMMYFAFGGEVIACCHNRKNILGRYPEQSLNEIWEGRELGVLRNYIANNDLSHGCEVCKTLLLANNFDGAKNALYDRYKVRKWPITMEFELDSTCNLECVICNDLFSSSIAGTGKKKSPYDEQFVSQLQSFIPHLREAKFYGGEPFLIPIYYDIWNNMLHLNPGLQILIQTNGSVLNDKVKTLLEQGNFSINISIDSLNKGRFEHIRKNAQFEKVMENTLWFAEYCHRKKTHFGIIPTPNRLNWMDLPELTAWAATLEGRVYFNTLITPLDLALWNMPSTELDEMIRELSLANLPQRTTVEKDNYRHFQDFLKQLEAWMATNLHNVDGAQKTAISAIEMQRIKSEFLLNLKNELKEYNDGAMMLQKFEQAIQELGTEQETDLVYLALAKIPVKAIIRELETQDSSQLRKIAGKKLFEAGGQFFINES